MSFDGKDIAENKKKKKASMFAICVLEKFYCISEECIFSANQKFFDLNFT